MTAREGSAIGHHLAVLDRGGESVISRPGVEDGKPRLTMGMMAVGKGRTTSLPPLDPGHYDLVIEGLAGWLEFKQAIELGFMEGRETVLEIRRPDGTLSVVIRRGLAPLAPPNLGETER